MYHDDDDEHEHLAPYSGPTKGPQAEEMARQAARLAEQRAYRSTPCPTASEIRHAMADLGTLLSDAISEIEAQIDACAAILRVGQPPYNGKIDVRWWKTSGGYDREPVLVKWLQDARRPGKLQPKRIEKYSSRVHRRDGLFAVNLPEVEKAAAQAVELIRWRREILSAVRYKIKPQNNIARNRLAWLAGHKYDASDLMAKVIAQTRRHGGTVALPTQYDEIFDMEQVNGLADDLAEKMRQQEDAR